MNAENWKWRSLSDEIAPEKKTIYGKTFAGFEDDHQQNSLTVKCLLDWLYTGIPPNVRSPDIWFSNIYQLDALIGTSSRSLYARQLLNQTETLIHLYSTSLHLSTFIMCHFWQRQVWNRPNHLSIAFLLIQSNVNNGTSNAVQCERSGGYDRMERLIHPQQTPSCQVVIIIVTIIIDPPESHIF